MAGNHFLIGDLPEYLIPKIENVGKWYPLLSYLKENFIRASTDLERREYAWRTYNDAAISVSNDTDQILNFNTDRFDIKGMHDATADLITNGAFTGDSGWTKGTGWSLPGTVALAANADSDLEQAVAITSGRTYTLVFTILNYVDGTITPKIGGTSGTARTANGTYTENIVAGNTNLLVEFTGSSAPSLEIDNVTLTTNSRVYLPIAGLYMVGANIRWEYHATGYRQVWFTVNGSVAVGMTNMAALTTNLREATMQSIDFREFAKNDYVEVSVRQTSGGALDAEVAAQYSPEFWGKWLAPATS